MLKVLLINDEYFILQILVEMVKKEFIIDIDTAMNGFEGYNMVLQKDYDFVICDLNMPVMDGYQFALKASANFNDSSLFFDTNNEFLT